MKILIVEDDRNLSEVIKENLLALNHTVDTATDGGEGSFLAKSYDYDMIILDYSLPKKDGLTVCKDIRSAGKSTPIIFMSVVGELDTKVSALNMGADDYIVKPFAFEELNARIEAICRRPEIHVPQDKLVIDDLVLDPRTHTVTLKGKEIHLTKKEFGVLEFLMRHKGTVVSRVLIMEHVWTADSDPFSNTIETHMRNLRRKLTIPGEREIISNVPGRGYIIG